MDGGGEGIGRVDRQSGVSGGVITVNITTTRGLIDGRIDWLMDERWQPQAIEGSALGEDKGGGI